MISRRRYDLVFAIYPQSRGFAFVLFEGSLAPVDWGVYEARGADKNTRCLSRIASLLALHTPEVLVLQNMSEGGTHRAPRIQELNRRAAELADQRGIVVRSYSRTQVLEYFAELDAMTKQMIAETIAKHIPALSLYVPPARKPWMSEDARMGIFDAVALAWVYFHSRGQRRAA
jgi:ABC-type Na+ transport system ATPase subunit NatA